MPLRSLAEPEEFAALEATFEEAWSAIASTHGLDPLRVPAQRERLAHIVVGLWKSGGKTPGSDLASQAIEQFLAVLSETDIPVRNEATSDTQPS